MPLSQVIRYCVHLKQVIKTYMQHVPVLSVAAKALLAINWHTDLRILRATAELNGMQVAYTCASRIYGMAHSLIACNRLKESLDMQKPKQVLSLLAVLVQQYR